MALGAFPLFWLTATTVMLPKIPRTSISAKQIQTYQSLVGR
jgi:hypothetical protein